LKINEKLPGFFSIDGKLATENRLKGFDPFGDGTVKIGGREFRFFNPERSKLAAAMVKNIQIPDLKHKTMLYLGAAHGYTVSHLSSICKRIYAVEFSERCFPSLLRICEKTRNIIPVFADARLVKYTWVENVDIVYADLAQSDQTEIAMRNAAVFLKKNGSLLLAIKTRSIDVTKHPRKVCTEEIKKLRKSGFGVISWKMLDPFEKAHGFVVAELREPSF